MDSQAYYSAGEVAWLLSIEDPRIARAMDEGMRCPLGALRETAGGGGVDDVGTVFTIARWHDVRRARAAVLAAKRNAALAEEILEGKLNGHSERDIALATGVSQMTVNRHFRATLAEIVEELGGEAPDERERVSRIPACLLCGERPRTRVPALRRRVKGQGMVEIRPERQSALCDPCLTESIARRLHAAMIQNGQGVQRCV